MAICAQRFTDSCIVTGYCPCGRDVLWSGLAGLVQATVPDWSMTGTLTGIQDLRNAMIALAEAIRLPDVT